MLFCTIASLSSLNLAPDQILSYRLCEIPSRHAELSGPPSAFIRPSYFFLFAVAFCLFVFVICLIFLLLISCSTGEYTTARLDCPDNFLVALHLYKHHEPSAILGHWLTEHHYSYSKAKLKRDNRTQPNQHGFPSCQIVPSLAS